MAKRRKKSTSTTHKLPSKAIIILCIIASIAFISTKALNQCENSANSQRFNGLSSVITAPETNEHIVNYKAMTISFNPKFHIPNWVSWELTGEETNGQVPREKKFFCDESVPGCADDWDYSYSGYDRGHMIPAADAKWDKTAMKETFYMTNICPQAKSLNTGAWKRLEEKCRIWAQADSSIFIVCGPIVSDKFKEYLGDSRVAVPKRFFKVILSPYSNPPRGIGFIMPNAKVPGGMQAAAVTIDSVEAVTGHDFFASLPDSIESQVESQCRFHKWSTLKPKKR